MTIENQTNRDDGQRSGMVRRVRKQEFPGEFLTPRADLDGALLIADIKEEALLNDIILLWGQLDAIDYEEGKQRLISRILGTKSLNGRASTEALEAYVGIFFPEATGWKSTKEQREALAKMQKPFKDRGEDNHHDADAKV